MKRNATILVILVVVIIGAGMVYVHLNRISQPMQHNQTAAQKSSPSQPPTPNTPTGIDKAKYSLSDPSSLWVIVNKTRALSPKTYTPADLVVPDIQLRSNITSDERQVRKQNADALKVMSDAAKKDGITLTLESGYRSYNFQVNLYNRYVSEQGQTVADTQSARPGYSEHQTGLAADLGGTTRPSCNVESCFATTVEGKWLATNAYKYGYIIRYPEGKTSVTGYEYEPWHVRYVGIDLSNEMHAKGIATLEEFFSLPAAPDYN